jgi:hypothetical protein
MSNARTRHRTGVDSMNQFAGRTRIAAVAAAMTTLGGCGGAVTLPGGSADREISGATSSSIASGGNSTTTVDGTGAIALHIAISGDVQPEPVRYVLQLGDAVVQSGTIDTNDYNAFDVQLGAVPAGSGYTMALTLSSPDGSVECMGVGGPFTVVAGGTVVEQVHLVCLSEPVPGPGGPIIGVEGFCGTWNSVTATSREASSAGSMSAIVLTATATALNTAAIAYDWSVVASTGGGVTLGAPAGNGTNAGTVAVTCNPSTQNGGAMIQLVVTDSSDGGPVVCPSTYSTTTIPVSCTAAN